LPLKCLKFALGGFACRSVFNYCGLIEDVSGKAKSGEKYLQTDAESGMASAKTTLFVMMVVQAGRLIDRGMFSKRLPAAQ
jgi:hypothetical protein